MKISKGGWEFAKANLNEAGTEELELLQKIIAEILQERKEDIAEAHHICVCGDRYPCSCKCHKIPNLL